MTRQQALKDELARTVYEHISDTSLSATRSEMLDLLLLLVQKVAGEFSEAQAMALLEPLWALSTASPNPYNPVLHNTAASTAVVHLLATRPEVESRFLERAVDYRGPERQLAFDLIARNIRQRGVSSSKALVASTKVLHLSVAEADRFIGMADITQRTASQRKDIIRRPARSRLSRMVATLGLAVVIVHAPLALILLVLFGSMVSTSNVLIDRLAEVPLEGALALLALIATLNVFTVQLSTTRLPATIARVSGQPWQLAGAYSTAITLLSTTVLIADSSSNLWKLLEVALLFTSLGWLAASLYRIFRRTDAAEACRVYVNRYMHRWNRAGSEFGLTQVRAGRLRQTIESLPFASIGSGEMTGHDVARIDATKRGVFLPSPRALQALLSHELFERGGYLQLPVGFGLVVPDGGNLALVRPPPGFVVPDQLVRKVLRQLRPRSATSIEDVSTQTITLASFALKTAGSGDARLAETIAEQAAEIMSSHLACVRRRRRWASRVQASGKQRLTTETQESFAVTPVLRDLLTLLVARAGESERVGAVTDLLVSRCLSAGGTAEQAPVMLTSLLTDAGAGAVGYTRKARWLRQAGVRALELNDDLGFEMTAKRLRYLADEQADPAYALSSLSALCVASLRMNPRRFEAGWDHISGWIDNHPESDDSVRWSLHVGAAAMEAGSYLAALSCARAIRTPLQRAKLTSLTSLERVFVEASVAGIFGLYLGRVPTDALERFRDFTNSLAPAVDLA